MSADLVTMGESYILGTTTMGSQRPFSNMTRAAPTAVTRPKMAMDAALPKAGKPPIRGRDQAGVGSLPDEAIMITPETWEIIVNYLDAMLDDPEALANIRLLAEIESSDDPTDQRLKAMDRRGRQASDAAMAADYDTFRSLPTAIKEQYGFDHTRWAADKSRRQAEARASSRSLAELKAQFPNWDRLLGGATRPTPAASPTIATDEQKATDRRLAMFPNWNRLG